MAEYRAAVIGTGQPPEERDAQRYGMGYRHGRGYVDHGGSALVACADLVRENAEAFAREFGVEEDAVYEDYGEMLASEDLDVVSVCTPAFTHPEVVVDCAREGDLDAIHCEKPMADTWAQCRLMAQEAWRQGVQLTFNHQLRFAENVREAKSLLDDGAIGELRRVEMSRGDLYERGIHQVDLCSYFSGDVPARWVLGGLDYRTEYVKYGIHNENQAVALWEYDNGVHGFAATGENVDAVGCGNRLLGDEGEIEVHGTGRLRVRRADDTGWETLEFEGGTDVSPAIAHVVDALDAGEEPTVSARNALNGHEVVFGVWESARRRGRVDLPLEVPDNPLRAMVESGDLTPEPADD